jgi:hypothetical protein
MIKTRTILLVALLMTVSLLTVDLMAQGNGKGKQNSNSPFLITGKMPHLTKLLMKQWDNPELHLSDEQKNKLLVVRKETIGNAQRLGKEITPLEKQVAEAILSGEEADSLQSIVQTIAKLKAEATMVHLRCIYNTQKILNQQQLDFLNSN